MVNAVRWSGIASHSGTDAFIIISNTSVRTRTGINRSAIDRHVVNRALNTATNVSRYSDNGTIQKSGTGAMSVEKYVVTASIRLDGTKASAIHVTRRFQGNRAVSVRRLG